MHDTLLSRFRGAFLGAFLGEAIAARKLAQQIKPLPLSLAQLKWSNLLLRQTDRLLISKNLERLVNSIAADAQTGAMQTGAELAIATLPMALFCHDQPAELRAVLRQLAVIPGLSSEAIDMAAAVGHAVSLLLRERFSSDLISQIMQDLDLPADAAWLEPLVQVQTWIEQPTDLATLAQWSRLPATAAQSSLPLALMLYSFLSTPEDFRLSLLRLTYLAPSESAHITHTLAGALSGLYNGLAGLPLAWRQQWALAADSLSNTTSVAETISEADLWQRTDRLLALWSGVIEPTDWTKQPHASLTAAPRVIR